MKLYKNIKGEYALIDNRYYYTTIPIIVGQRWTEAQWQKTTKETVCGCLGTTLQEIPLIHIKNIPQKLKRKFKPITIARYRILIKQ